MKNHEEVRAEFLTYLEIEERIKKSPVVYIPLGAFEFHGPHLPTGLDGLNAHAVCVGAAKQTGGVVLPTIYQGTGGEHSDYPWTIMMPTGQSLHDNLVVTLTRLSQLGVAKTVILSGHFADEQRALLRELVKEWESDKSHSMQVVARSVADCDSSPVAPDHAGVFESLLLAATHPKLVNLGKLPNPSKHPSIDPDGNPFGRHRHNKDHALWGVFGPDPRKLDVSEAPILLKALVNWLAQLGRINHE